MAEGGRGRRYYVGHIGSKSKDNVFTIFKKNFFCRKGLIANGCVDSVQLKFTENVLKGVMNITLII